MSKPLIQIGTEVREMTDEEIESIEIERIAEASRVAVEAEALAAEEAAKQQAFNDAVAQAVAAILAAQTPATTAEPAVEEPTVTE